MRGHSVDMRKSPEKRAPLRLVAEYCAAKNLSFQVVQGKNHKSKIMIGGRSTPVVMAGDAPGIAKTNLLRVKRLLDHH